MAEMMRRPTFLIGLDDPRRDLRQRVLQPQVRGHDPDTPAILIVPRVWPSRRARRPQAALAVDAPVLAPTPRYFVRMATSHLRIAPGSYQRRARHKGS